MTEREFLLRRDGKTETYLVERREFKLVAKSPPVGGTPCKGSCHIPWVKEAEDFQRSPQWKGRHRMVIKSLS